MALKCLTNPKNVEFPSQHHHEKCNRIGIVGVGLVSKTEMTWEDHTGDVFIVGVVEDYVAAEVLYL